MNYDPIHEASRFRLLLCPGLFVEVEVEPDKSVVCTYCRREFFPDPAPVPGEVISLPRHLLAHP
jgi:hypothetical protein